jgi:DNA-binding beta-propeller fold protein YncE
MLLQIGDMRSLPLIGAILLCGCSSAGTPDARRPTPDAPAPERLNAQVPASAYYVYIANESSDIVSRVVFSPANGLKVESKVPVGIMPADIDGPHGITVSPDGRAWFVSIAHGTPFGRVWKYVAGADTAAGRVELGMFPASMATSPDGNFLYVVNFNLHGDPVPSSVSIVYTPTMTEVARPTTCVMPHGSRLNQAGTKHYSTCMHSEQLVEIDTRNYQVSSRINLSPGSEHKLPVSDVGGEMHHMGTRTCSPTWAQPGRGAWAGKVYVACNKNAEVLEVDATAATVSRRFPSGKGPYNIAVSPDGRLILVTLKSDQGVQIIDLQSGKELARVATTQPITHGVVVSPDGLFAFVTNEAIGSTRGTVDVIDLRTLQRVATAALEYQPGGIDFWKTVK